MGRDITYERWEGMKNYSTVSFDISQGFATCDIDQIWPIILLCMVCKSRMVFILSNGWKIKRIFHNMQKWYVLPIIAFMLKWQSWVVVAETKWLQRPNIIWCFTENICWPLIYSPERTFSEVIVSRSITDKSP